MTAAETPYERQGQRALPALYPEERANPVDAYMFII